jgi:hypothetical protein
MKKYSIVIVLLASFTLHAQTEKGMLMLGGSASASSGNNTLALEGSDQNTKNRSASFAPNVGFFASDRFAMGVAFSFSVSRYELESINYHNRTTGFGIGPSFRYYFPFEEKWAAFPAVSFMYQSYVGKSTQIDPVTGVRFEDSNKYNAATLDLGGGLTYFINKSIGLEGVLVYQVRSADKGTNYGNSLSFNIGFQIYLPN